jgi:hypothetical protein
MGLRLAADRSVVGCMTDMANQCTAVARMAGGVASANIADINRALRRNINSARGYAHPIELVTQRLDAASRRLLLRRVLQMSSAAQHARLSSSAKGQCPSATRHRSSGCMPGKDASST